MSLLISKIKIQYLRSIYELNIKDLDEINIFSGSNDVGKSNIIKALNLFFNGQFDWDTPFSFQPNYSHQRLKDVKRAKAGQLFQVSVTFNRPSSYKNSLPPTFTVRRRWTRTDFDQWDDVEKRLKHKDAPNTTPTKASQQLTKFLNRLRFYYVPAIRSVDYFSFLLSQLQDVLIDERNDDPLEEAARTINERINKQTLELQKAFNDVAGLGAKLALPTDTSELFKAMSILTDSEIPLQNRGDGIQGLYIPAVLDYICRSNQGFSMWGFEEPENSLEYVRVQELVAALQNQYAKSAQIFISTHSPALVSMEGENVTKHRVFRGENDNTLTVRTYAKGTEYDENSALISELGFLDLANRVDKAYRDGLAEIEDLRRKASELAKIQRPMLYVEGKNDVITLRYAWKTLFPDNECPFDIEKADPNPESKGGGAGADSVKKYLEVASPNSPFVIVGLFDRDDEGLNKYGSLPNGLFTKDENNKSGFRKGKNKRKVAAVLLPIPSFRSDFDKARNLPMEYLFTDKILSRRHDNKGINFYYEIIIPGKGKVRLTDDERKELTKLDIPFARRKLENDGGKEIFSKHIVPTLSSSDFIEFKPLFELILTLINEL